VDSGRTDFLESIGKNITLKRTPDLRKRQKLRQPLRRNDIAPYFEVALGGSGMGIHHISLDRTPAELALMSLAQTALRSPALSL
jgi:hypothetical protein